MDEIIQALTQLRQNPNNNQFTDEDLISMYGLNRPSFNQGNTGIFSNINFPQINLPKFDNMRNLVTSGIGALARIPGLGFMMNAFTRPNYPSDAMSKSFAVENYGDPYNYNMGSGNLTGKDPFGINTVSMFGNYPGYYDQYAQDYEAGKYSLTSKFAKDKYQHALNVNKTNLDRIQKDYGSTDKTFNWQDHEQDKGGDVPGGGNFNTSKSGMKEGAFGTYDGSPGRKDYGRGGLASLWRR